MRKRKSTFGCLLNFILMIIASIVGLVLFTLYSFKSNGFGLLISKNELPNVTQKENIVTQSNFDSIINVTFDFEGDFQNYETDVANYNSLGECIGTNHGISAIALETYLGYPVQPSDVLNLTIPEAKEIYRLKFWNEVRGEEIKNRKLSHLIFDAYIANPSTCRQMLCLTLQKFDIDIQIQRGAFSDNVINSINLCNPEQFYKTFWEYRRLNFESLREKYPQFITGWLNRLNKLKYK